jgi:hypothetical protein
MPTLMDECSVASDAPEIDIRNAADARLAGVPDPEVLRRTSEQGRVLVSQDRRTMPGHFHHYVSAGAKSPGVILLRETVSIAAAIEELVLIWSASEADEWTNRLLWIPL